MNVLVTGANGQLGNEMRLMAQNSSYHYIFTDVEELDITDFNAILQTVKEKEIQIIVNCAAYTNVDKAENDFDIANALNNIAVGRLANVAKAQNATLIHISTDYVFNGNNHIPYTEDDITDPIGVYGKTKLAGEETIKKVGCNYIILRTAWLYSKWGNNFVKTMQKLTLEKDSLSVIFDQIGSPTYAKDLAHAISLIIERNMLNQQGIYHYSNEGVCSWFDFAKEICELSGHNCNITPIHSQEYPSKVTRPHYSVLDKTKFKETFGIPVPYWKDSLKKCINELKEMQL
ncbi:MULTISPECIES: dTDP-4-dehydrorhamnose reductase [Phocaeicola]|jgi:dTDP-4-dehydrorhamnose reductase|uniref:dTDP-4-dehydrorhamnose reductase n=1 Tax=Phocaeicola vulgatus TaxID=821 RepID=A0A412VSI7_PHOVU|nr:MULTISPECIES: dTDP-4-dehydrorhamnose reductase [Phocaeicola]MCG0296611.1 dTDP-4-dehydrorhamnose reductase [Phocaeicola vulgatus]MCG0338953.1 dTDP-4-dehydrorhamnose reductase [Phocaeicola vulgatus]RGJ44307.1 dTDP-4-dehydrorhamnose reductase [Phocaeicola vulgatus]RGV12640.1 dTDP-4-dehydrorhamnose reductase [Phocaeicola vulgatus]RGW10691.1 dTDP-4-dehydrorhamnose reductase [Phocaeicola vulgatus]